MSYVFIFITSDSCGACVSFKQQHMNSMLDKLKNLDLNIIHINLKEMAINTFNPNSDMVKYIKGKRLPINPEFIKIVTGYPQFFIFSLNNWLSNTQLKGYIFNGYFNENGSISTNSNDKLVVRTAENIYKWADSIIKTPNSNNSNNNNSNSNSNNNNSNNNNSNSNSNNNNSNNSNSNSNYNSNVKYPSYIMPYNYKMKIKSTTDD